MNDINKRLPETIILSNNIEKHQKALKDNPNSMDTLKELANIYESHQEITKAVDYYNRIIQLTPNDSNIYLKIASLKARKKDFATALINYQTALTIKPNQPAWVFIGLGDTLNNTNQIEEAILAFQKAIDLKPNYGLAHAKLASTLSIKDEDNEAIKAYQKAFYLQSELPLWAYTNFSKILNKNNLFEASIKICKQGLELYTNNIDLLITLAEAHQKRGDAVEAINNYHKAIKFRKRQPAWLYQSLGDLLFENGHYQEAIDNYVQSLQINNNKFGSYARLDKAICKLYTIKIDNLNLDFSLILNGNIAKNKSIIVSLQSYFDFGFLGKQGETIDPLSYYFINHNLKIIYCSIPKNACTLFKNLIVEYSDNKTEYEKYEQNIHRFLVSKRDDVSTLISCLQSPEYFKFVLLRNPFARLASGYLDKFAKHLHPESFAVDVIKDVQDSLGLEINIKKSITFEQFIKYLARKEDYELNDHWRPQNNFTGSIEFDLIGQFENLDYVIDTLQNRYGIRIKKKVSEHGTKYQDFAENLPFYSMYPEELRNLRGMPRAGQLYSSELENIVRARYKKDIELYEAMFNVSLDDLNEHL